MLLVVDASEPVEEMREKLVTSHDTLYERNEAPIVTVFNKADMVDDEEVRRKRARSRRSPRTPSPSAPSGAQRRRPGRASRARTAGCERERLLLPMADDTMSLVSWLYDHASVETDEYGDQVIEFEARPAIVEQSRAKAGDLVGASA